MALSQPITFLLLLSTLSLSISTVFGLDHAHPVAPPPPKALPPHHHHYHHPPSKAPIAQPPSYHHHPPSQPPIAQPPSHHHHHHHPHPHPHPHAPSHAPVSPPVHPAPMHAPPAHPPSPSHAPEHHHYPPAPSPSYRPKPHYVPRSFIAVQGVVYCKSCKYGGANTLLGASPVPGATVKLVCKNTKYTLVQKATTDKNGYFHVTAPKTITSYAFHKCKVFLRSSPLVKCSKPSDLHGGLNGAILRPEKSYLDEKNRPFVLYTVGPFAFEPACPR